MAYRYRGHGSQPESAGGSHGVAAYGDPSQRRKYAARKSESPCCRSTRKTSGAGLSITSEQRRAAVSRISVTSSLLASAGGRYRQHHARDRVRERPVDKLLGNKRLVRHDYLFTVPVADGGGAGVNFRHATGEIANCHRIANANRFFRTG